MKYCESCGGRLGVDCFNPIECAQITANINQETAKPITVKEGEETRLFRETNTINGSAYLISKWDNNLQKWIPFSGLEEYHNNYPTHLSKKQADKMAEERYPANKFVLDEFASICKDNLRKGYSEALQSIPTLISELEKEIFGLKYIISTQNDFKGDLERKVAKLKKELDKIANSEESGLSVHSARTIAKEALK